MKKIHGTFFLLFLILSGCSNLEDAELSQRQTFIRFFEGANGLAATSAEVIPDGFIITGTIRIANDTISPEMVVIKTDQLGQKQWEKVIPGGMASGLKVWTNGYILVGDSVRYNPESGKISELENKSSRLILLDHNGNITRDISYHRQLDDAQVDYHTDALTLDDQGNIVTLGSFKVPGANEFAYVTALNATTLDTLWYKNYDYLQRDYVNAKSVFHTGGKVMWGTSVSSIVGNFNRSYLALPVILGSSTFVNSNYFGENIQQSLRIKDLQRSFTGFGAIGTFSEADGSKGNIFFVSVDPEGNFKEESVRYFDGFISSGNTALTDATLSSTEDTGDAITATRDGGYVLAGTLTTTPDRGNGGKDIWITKLDAQGNALWNKIIGGATNELVSSIRETADGGLLICGTVQDGNEQTGGLSSILLIKTDSNGDLKN